MTVLPVGVYPSPDDLLRAAEQLGPEELRRFVADVLALRARREGPTLEADEAGLLGEINRGLPDELRDHLDELIERRRAEALSPEERDELIGLSDEVERREADRLAALAKLATLRGTTLAALMADLGIAAPAHG